MRLVEPHRPLARAIIALAIGVVVAQAPRSEAHKAITSPYTYNEHVFPILRDRCGRCHAEGGPTPMSLTTYAAATPWAQSMREQLLWERMPPWYADPAGPAVKGGQTLTPRELDVLITWATGGNPEGDVATRPAPVPPPPEWWAGKPDFVVAMPEAYALSAGTLEARGDFTLATGLTEAKWVKGVDLLPGASSMVREALIQIENGPVLAVWVPGHDARAMTPPGGAGFKLPAGARLRLQVRYKKNWQDEQKMLTDRSTVGLYFMEPPVSGKEIQAATFDSTVPGGVVSPASIEPRKLSGLVRAAVRVLAVRPILDQPYASLTVQAILPGGRQVPLLLLRAPRQEWPRRYWLADPIELPRETTVEMIATPMPPDPDEIPAPRRDSFQVALDYIAM
jgi:hypothetical protein